MVIEENCPQTTVMPLNTLSFCTDEFDAACILGGNEDRPLILNASLRCCVENMRKEGKPVFTEFVASVGGCYMNTIETVSHHRMVYLQGGLDAFGLIDGDILDGHLNECIKMAFIPQNAVPILVYHSYLCAHDHINLSRNELGNGVWALFFAENTLISTFRMCNFRRARLAPHKSYEAIITQIVRHLTGEETQVEFPPPVCTFDNNARVDKAEDVDNAVLRGVNWIKRSGVLVDGGRGGVKEGFSHHINAKNGCQLRTDLVRNDCSSEIAGALLFNAIIQNDFESYKIYSRISDFCFDYLQVKDGSHKGMLRWSEQAWETCYQDDAARVLLPSLMEENFFGGCKHIKSAYDALDYLAKTTGTDGLRKNRTDICKLSLEKMEQISSLPSGNACAHYNAYYHAALLLAYRAAGAKEYLKIAQKGLEAIMTVYPDTIRETSETEEMCRLIFPLAVLFEITGNDKHKEWLYRVTNDLQKHRHESGGYMEWDTGYKAACSRREAGECALLAQNGDPVADLLYSVNWLPLGYSYAYFATGDVFFYDLWKSTARFLLSCQIQSDDLFSDGAWARAFDMERREIYGVPHDVGWSPCCIESGWTVGEILMGLQFMQTVTQSKKDDLIARRNRFAAKINEDKTRCKYD